MAQQMEEKPLTLDFSGMKEALVESQRDMVNQIRESLKPAEPAQGKGIVGMSQDKANKLVESLQKVKSDGWKLEEQWTVVIPAVRTKETSAGLRDYVYVDEQMKGEPGDVLNIPYVMDADFETLGSVGAAFASSTAESSIMTSVTTTLYEAGLWADLSYYLIERFNQNLLNEINTMLANAAVRSEDKKIMQLIEAGTASAFAGQVQYSGVDGVGTLCTASAAFYAANIPKALGKLINAGKNAKPNQCVLYLTPTAYGALLSEIMASQAFAFAAPSLINQGIVEKLLGVAIVVGGYAPSQQRTNAATGTVDLCYFMRGKRAVVLAPKRELLIETQKQIATRKLRITASHTFGVKLLDQGEIVRIWTSHVRAS